MYLSYFDYDVTVSACAFSFYYYRPQRKRPKWPISSLISKKIALQYAAVAHYIWVSRGVNKRFGKLREILGETRLKPVKKIYVKLLLIALIIYCIGCQFAS